LKTPDGSVTLQTLTVPVSGGAWSLDLPPGATPAFPDGHFSSRRRLDAPAIRRPK